MNPSDFETISLGIDQRVATITLNRPDRLNAYTRRMFRELSVALDHCESDAGVGAIILTGAGRAFCAGMDMGGGESAFSSEDKVSEQRTADGRYRDLAGILSIKMLDSSKPIIVAANGAAVGIGASLQMAADIRMASTAAFYIFPFVRRGVVPEGASAWFLPRHVGLGNALKWAMTGERVSAEEAWRTGLVQSLHAPEELMDAAISLARDIVSNAAPVSLALTRQMFWRNSMQPTPMAAHRIDSLAMEERGASADSREGVRAFMEKRLPDFPQNMATDRPDFYPWWDSEVF